MVYVVWSYQQEFESYWIYYQMWILMICWFVLPIGNAITLMQVLAKKNPNIKRIHSALVSIDRRQVIKYAYLVSLVLVSVMQSWAMYSMHFLKSLGNRASKLKFSRKKSSRKHKSSSSSKGKSGASSSKPKQAVKKENEEKKEEAKSG